MFKFDSDFHKEIYEALTKNALKLSDSESDEAFDNYSELRDGNAVLLHQSFACDCLALCSADKMMIVLDICYSAWNSSNIHSVADFKSEDHEYFLFDSVEALNENLSKALVMSNAKQFD